MHCTLNIFARSFYGRSLWSIISPACERLFKAWNAIVCQEWKSPCQAHRYLIEPISGSCHPKVMLASRFSSFTESLLSSPKYAVRFLAGLSSKDYRPNMGKQPHQIGVECGAREQQALTAGIVKEEITYFRTPQVEKWRIGIIKELLEENMEFQLSADQVKTLLTFLCTT